MLVRYEVKSVAILDLAEYSLARAMLHMTTRQYLVAQAEFILLRN